MTSQLLCIPDLPLAVKIQVLNSCHNSYVLFCPSTLPSLLVILLTLLFLLLLLLVLIQATRGDAVQSQDGLVGVLEQDKFAVAALVLQAHVGNGADDTPSVGEGQVHLSGKVAGLPANNAENDVLVVGAGIDTGDETGYSC